MRAGSICNQSKLQMDYQAIDSGRDSLSPQPNVESLLDRMVRHCGEINSILRGGKYADSVRNVGWSKEVMVEVEIVKEDEEEEEKVVVVVVVVVVEMEVEALQR
ncbi:hypothetical protein HZH66_007421 [Vespula vulgaris]|uniref:Uncharacterized protein n=1 Tax=Vespula vulgaris TaxID=7454 RepID=A0A834N6A4_VESVU|nr:hypothetical protein HZH66_007421 [Vespula vulgaris]